MNILILTENFPPMEGGIAVFSKNVCEQLSRFRENRVEVLCSSQVMDKEFNPKQLDYPVHYYSTPRRLSSLFPFFKTIFYSLKNRVDIVFLTHFMSTHGLGALFLRKIFGIPYVILIHGFEFRYYLNNSRIDDLVSRVVLKNASFTIANSNFTKAEIMKFGYGGNRITIVNPGVDIDRFNPDVDFSGIESRYNLYDKRVILTVSRLVKRKGHVNVLRALPMVIQHIPDLVYLIVGIGEEEEHLRSIVKELGLLKHVVFTGYIGENELPEVYCAGDVFIMTSYEIETEGNYEGFGIAFLEAGACGKPVVGGNSGGIPEAVIDGTTGLLVDPMDIEEIARALIKLLADKDYPRTLGENGRRRVEREFSWKRVGEKMMTALKEFSAC